MRALAPNQIKGTWATLVLPIAADETIDFGCLSAEIDYLISSGVSGIYSNGTAGEFYNQTEAEFDKISQILANKCESAGMAFQLGCSHMSPIISLERLKRIKSLNPSAIQVILPDWVTVTDEEIFSYMDKLAHEAHPIGLVLYNPPHAKQVLAPQQFERLLNAGIPLAGCKVAAGDIDWYAAMKGVINRISVFVPGHRLATGVSSGAHGAYSNVACINPVAAKKWYSLMQEDMQEALALEKRIMEFFRVAIFPLISNQGYSNTAVDKFLVAVGGWIDMPTKVRWPYRSIPEDEVSRVRKIAKRIIPEFYNF
jgi:dihydrodipicolinate synthase/N-acetylneuraminate lyase